MHHHLIINKEVILQFEDVNQAAATVLPVLKSNDVGYNKCSMYNDGNTPSTKEREEGEKGRNFCKRPGDLATLLELLPDESKTGLWLMAMQLR